MASKSEVSWLSKARRETIRGFVVKKTIYLYQGRVLATESYWNYLPFPCQPFTWSLLFPQTHNILAQQERKNHLKWFIRNVKLDVHRPCDQHMTLFE